jgi:mannose-6-phosphate isomerase-like protein (cupin superfamily)
MKGMVLMRQLVIILCCAFLSLANAFPQATTVITYSPAQLLQMAEPLHAQAKSSNGTATKILEQFPGYYTMLVYREKNGEVEVHEKFVDVMMIVNGSATLVTGGSGENMKMIRPNELRGTDIRGGSPVTLTRGVVVRVPAGVPHQVLVHAGHSITYFVVKVEDKPQ